MPSKKRIRLPDEHPDFRTAPSSWPDFAKRADNIFNLVLDEYWESTSQTEIKQKTNRLYEMLDFLRDFEHEAPINDAFKKLIYDVSAKLRALRPKPEFRNPAYDFKAIRLDLLQKWAKLKAELQAL